MARIFFALALFALALLGVNFVLGLRIIHDVEAESRAREAKARFDELRKSGPSPERDAARREWIEAKDVLAPHQRRKMLHILFGIGASLVTLLVNSVAVTYFVGTSRWCREVVETYGLDSELAQRSNQLKRRTFPWAVAGMLTIVAIAALGAASDPVATGAAADSWVTLHFVCALLGAGFIAVSFLMQVGNVGANYEVIEEILAEVQRVRGEHRTLNIEH